jgi:TPR repeat protein
MGEIDPDVYEYAQDGDPEAQFLLAHHYYPLSRNKVKYKFAVPWYTKSAKNGHSEARYYLAYMYEHGIGCEKNTDQSLQWYYQAALQEHFEAQFRLAFIYRDIRHNNENALWWFSRLLEKEYKTTECQYNIALIYDSDPKHLNRPEAFNLFYQAGIEGNDAPSLYKVGRYYQLGLAGQPQSYLAALECYRKSSDIGYGLASYELGLAYELGRGVKDIDFKKAYEYYQLCLNSNIIEPMAYYKLGMFHKLHYVEHPEKAFQYFRQAALNQVHEAKIEVALLYHQEQKSKMAFTWFMDASSSGNPEAIYFLALYYERGLYVVKDDAKALGLYEKAAIQGHTQSQYMLGLMYSEGRGSSKNLLSAFKWFSEASEKDHPQALYEKGSFYLSGRLFEQNYKVAFACLEKSAEKGCLEAQAKLGWMHELGLGVDSDLQVALSWYLKAAKQGHSPSQYNVGKLYECGKSIEQNLSLAHSWYTKAAYQEHKDAQFHLGLLYRNGFGVETDDILAFEWIKKSAMNGHTQAQFYTGLMYHRGKGTPQNSAKAHNWYSIAANNDSINAQFNLGSMFAKGDGVVRDTNKAKRWYESAILKRNEEFEYTMDTPFHSDQSKSAMYKSISDPTLHETNTNDIVRYCLGKGKLLYFTLIQTGN